MENSYLKTKRQRIELLLRMYIGMQELFYHPYKNLPIVALVGVFAILWKYKEKIFHIPYLPVFFGAILQNVISVLLVVMLMLFVLVVIKQIGYTTAQHDEAMMILAFKPTDLRNGCYPLLISKRKIKGTDVIIREFYSKIPKHRWEEMQEEIADALNATFVKPYIEYGGKRKDKAYRIVIYTIPNRRFKERGHLYDEEI